MISDISDLSTPLGQIDNRQEDFALLIMSVYGVFPREMQLGHNQLD